MMPLQPDTAAPGMRMDHFRTSPDRISEPLEFLRGGALSVLGGRSVKRLVGFLGSVTGLTAGRGNRR
jgi:hypothetical protein